MKKKCRNNKNGDVCRALIRILFVISVIMLMTGCRSRKRNENLKDDNNVAGFLFHFDQRSETRRLVSFKSKNKLPVRVSWKYPDRTAETADEDMIVDILNAFNNVIVVGSGNNVVTDVDYFITFTLPDESECRFDFISENTIRISDHNYTIESDGTLWEILKDGGETLESVISSTEDASEIISTSTEAVSENISTSTEAASESISSSTEAA